MCESKEFDALWRYAVDRRKGRIRHHNLPEDIERLVSGIADDYLKTKELRENAKGKEK